MRKAPTILAGVMLAITIPRVAHLAGVWFGAGILGWVFAIALSGGLFLCGYYGSMSIIKRKTAKRGKKPSRRRPTWAGVRAYAQVLWLALVVADGALNLADVWLSVAATATIMMQATAIVYGALPTLAAAAFGGLQSRIDQVSRGGKKRASLADALYNLALERVEVARGGGKVAEKAQQVVDLKTFAGFVAESKRRNGSGPVSVAEQMAAGVPETTARRRVKQWQRRK